MLRTSGIYQIFNNVTNDFYIGSASSFYKRKSAHWSYLENNKHYNVHLQRAVNKYGIENFEFKVIQECNKDELVFREQFYIDTLKPSYNIRIIANSNIGLRFSEEHKKKLSKSLTGKKRTQEQKDAQRLIKLGKLHTEKTKNKVSEVVNKLKGNKVGDKIDRDTIVKLAGLLNSNISRTIKDICKENNINYRSALRFVNNQTWKEFFPLLNKI